MSKVILLILSLLPGIAGAEPASPVRALALNEVLDAALRAFPGLLAAEQRKQVSEGELQTAQGGFDTLLKSQNRWSVAGLYENNNYDVVVEQPTAFLGSTFFACQIAHREKLNDARRSRCLPCPGVPDVRFIAQFSHVAQHQDFFAGHSN